MLQISDVLGIRYESSVAKIKSPAFLLLKAKKEEKAFMVKSIV